MGADPKRLFPELYTSSITARLYSVAARDFPGKAPNAYPEYTHPGGPNTYEGSAPDFWTSGFFPGLLYSLLERHVARPTIDTLGPLSEETWRTLADHWTDPLAASLGRIKDHDAGFMAIPFLKRYHLYGGEETRDVLVKAATRLRDRFDERVGCIRSWDTCVTKRYRYGPDSYLTDFLVIIDNMMNLELLYAVSEITSDPSYANVASLHATTTAANHIRQDGSTPHVLDYDPKTGKVQKAFANQGYSDESCWSRGQAWGIYGFANCARRTGRHDFLTAAIRLADYFLSRLPEDGVPHWDFDCPRPTFRDTSAGTCAANGMLLIYEDLSASAFASHPSCPSRRKYLDAAFKLMRDVLDMSLTPPALFFQNGEELDVDLGEGGWETILKNATINNYEYAPRRWADTGLVYGDYYAVEFGNRILSGVIDLDGASQESRTTKIVC